MIAYSVQPYLQGWLSHPSALSYTFSLSFLVFNFQKLSISLAYGCSAMSHCSFSPFLCCSRSITLYSSPHFNTTSPTPRADARKWIDFITKLIFLKCMIFLMECYLYTGFARSCREALLPSSSPCARVR
jgi:hypothetical protein